MSGDDAILATIVEQNKQLFKHMDKQTESTDRLSGEVGKLAKALTLIEKDVEHSSDKHDVLNDEVVVLKESVDDLSDRLLTVELRDQGRKENRERWYKNIAAITAIIALVVSLITFIVGNTNNGKNNVQTPDSTRHSSGVSTKP